MDLYLLYMFWSTDIGCKCIGKGMQKETHKKLPDGRNDLKQFAQRLIHCAEDFVCTTILYIHMCASIGLTCTIEGAGVGNLFGYANVRLVCVLLSTVK